MLEQSSLENRQCQPILAFAGKRAKINLNSSNFGCFSDLNFKDIHGIFHYEIKISKFSSEIFSNDPSNYFAYLVQTYVKSDNSLESPFNDANVFLEKNFEDLIEYSIILPRLFKMHHRYVLDMERDRACLFKEFGQKVNLWKKSNGLF